MKRVFIDTNIILDVMAKREGYADSHAVLSLCYEGVMRGYISQGSLYTLLYMLQAELGKTEARLQVMGLLTFLRVASCSSAESFRVLQANFPDNEDALQMQTAIAAGAQAIITRNHRHYKQSTVPVFSPEEFRKVLVT